MNEFYAMLISVGVIGLLIVAVILYTKWEAKRATKCSHKFDNK